MAASPRLQCRVWPDHDCVRHTLVTLMRRMKDRIPTADGMAAIIETLRLDMARQRDSFRQQWQL